MTSIHPATAPEGIRLTPTTDGQLELHDIQSGVLRPRPTPYAATYVALRIDTPEGGRELMRRLANVVASAAHPESPTGDTWVSASLTFQALRALGLPQAMLDSFPLEFREGMAARAHLLGDVGRNAPEHWEKPLGTADIQVVITVIAPDSERRDRALARARDAYRELKGVTATWRQDTHVGADEREPFGFKDGMSHPAILGSGIAGTNPHEPPLQPGEFVLGYPDEMAAVPMIPQPAILWRNGSFVVFRKLYQDVAAFRRYLRDNASTPEMQELIAAKMMGRWRSGAPLARCPMHDDPELGADPARNNDFTFKADDAIGYQTPRGSHIRRMNPRDSDISGMVRIHRMIRRGTAYGPPLADGVMEDDGEDRGLLFAFVGAHLGRQFEFVQSEWMHDGQFFGGGNTTDPVSGAGEGTFDIPRRPLKLRLKGLPQFVTTRGGEYCFMPGLSALRWLAAGEYGSA